MIPVKVPVKVPVNRFDRLPNSKEHLKMTAIAWPIALMLSKASFRCLSVIRSVYYNLLQGPLQGLYSTRVSTHVGQRKNTITCC